MQADALADVDAHSCSDVDAHSCADVEVRACLHAPYHARCGPVHTCAWDRAGTAPILALMRGGTEADLRCDWRNGGAHVERQHSTSFLRMQADALADVDAHSYSDVYAHACADVHVRACSACAISCALWAHGHRHAR
jgi:hypothetical protein